MTWVKLVWTEVLGMFVDDGALALQSVLLIAGVTVAVKVVGAAPLAGAIVLLLGLMFVLWQSLARKARGDEP